MDNHFLDCKTCKNQCCDHGCFYERSFCRTLIYDIKKKIMIKLGYDY